MGYILTVSKKPFTIMEPSKNQMDIEDIAHALSMLCRANGHFHSFYSVAQHSLNCAQEAGARGYSERVQLACLLHDASEAYLSDVTRPVKQFLPLYLEMEERVQMEIWKKWLDGALSEEEKTQVFTIDDTMLYHEFQYYMHEAVFPKALAITSTPDFQEHSFREVREQFLARFYQLYKGEIDCG